MHGLVFCTLFWSLEGNSKPVHSLLLSVILNNVKKKRQNSLTPCLPLTLLGWLVGKLSELQLGLLIALTENGSPFSFLHKSPAVSTSSVCTETIPAPSTCHPWWQFRWGKGKRSKGTKSFNQWQQKHDKYTEWQNSPCRRLWVLGCFLHFKRWLGFDDDVQPIGSPEDLKAGFTELVSALRLRAFLLIGIWGQLSLGVGTARMNQQISS